MTDRALLQQALEALQTYGAHTPNCDHLMLLTSLPPQRKPCSCGLVAAIVALRERLAQPEQEPVSLNDGRLTQYPDGSIGVGTPAERPKPPTA